MDPPSWSEIVGLLTVSLGWAEFFRRISEDRKRDRRKRRKRE